MHILFLSDNFPPEVNAPATRTWEHICEWEKLGAKVTVITCAPNFPKGRVFEGHKNRLYSKEKLSENITLIRVWSYITSNKGFARRILDYMSYACTSFLAGLFIRKVDLIIATSPQFFTTWSGYALSIFKRKPWIFELRDLWPESIVTVGAMKKGKAIKLLEKIELFLYKKAHKIISVTDSFVENLANRGVDRNKISVVKNGVDLEKFKRIEPDDLLQKKINPQNRFVVSYIGTMGMAHAIDFIIDSVASMDEAQRKNFLFLFVGDGAKRYELEEKCRKLDLKNIIFTGMVSKEDVKRYISISDAALVNLKKCDTFKTVIPSKMFEMAAMGKPILLGVDGEARRMIESYDVGLAYEPENREEFLEKLHSLSSDKNLYEKFKKNCRLFANDYDRKKLAGSMFNILKSINNKEG